jgi:hypothetical protein
MWPAALADRHCPLLSMILRSDVAPMRPTVTSLEGASGQSDYARCCADGAGHGLSGPTAVDRGEPEGCAKSDVAVELPVRVHGSVWWRSAAPAGEAILMLSKLAYLTLCRSIQLLSLLARGDAAKPGSTVDWVCR